MRRYFTMARHLALVLSILYLLYCDHVTGENVMLNAGQIELDTTCFSEWQQIRIKQFLNLSEDFSKTKSNTTDEITREIKKRTTKQILLTVKYPTPYARIFTCTGNLTGRNLTWQRRISHTVTLPANVGSQLIGVRFRLVSNVESNHLMEVYVRVKPGTNITLYYCWVDENGFAIDAQTKFVCPSFISANFECAQRNRVVYGIENSSGFLCQAIIPNVYVYSKYQMYIATKGRYFSSQTGVYAVSTLGSSKDQNSTYIISKSGAISAVLVSQTPLYITAKADDYPRQINLHWQNTGAIVYKINYNCSNGDQKSTTSYMQYKNIIDPQFKPVTLCRFCVQGLQVSNTIYSEPVCNTTRFPEEPPTQAPTITCNSETCPASDDGDTRHVTITCRFPSTEEQNGVIRKLTVQFWSDSSESEYRELSVDNVTSCRVHLKGLSTDRVHFARISACNLAGCSRFSSTVQIDSVSPHREQRGTGNSSNTLIAILLPALVFLVVIGVLVWFCWLKKKKPRGRLASIEEPPHYDEMGCGDGSTPTEYNQLDQNENAAQSSTVATT